MIATSPRRHYKPNRVTVVGAGNVGSIVAQRLLERNLTDVVLVDITEGKPQAMALDLLHARATENHDRMIIGTNDYSESADSDVIVITAGLPRKPGMTRDDLLRINADIIRSVVPNVAKYSPDAVLIVVTNPLDAMTHLAWQVSGFPIERVMGMAGVLDAARFKAFIAMELGISISDISAMVLGSHGDLMVPLPRYATINGVSITELIAPEVIERLINRTRNAGAEIVALMQKGSAYFAPASAVCTMVESILRDQHRILPVAAYLQGQYGLNDIFMGVPVQLGRSGILRVVELDLLPEEMAALHASADAVRQSMAGLTNLNQGNQ
ncbi:MAG: malate dehydrogenase [Pseudanabaena sp. ELA607]|jgi:malate dehydrogenase